MATKTPIKPAAKKRKPKVTDKKPTTRPKRAKAVTKHGGKVPHHEVDANYLTEPELNKRELFAQAYLAHGKLGPAAKAAGCQCKNAMAYTTAGWKLYQEPAVKARIDELSAEIVSELRLTQRTMVHQLMQAATLDPAAVCDPVSGELLPMHEIPLHTRLAIASYKVTRKSLGDAGEVEDKEVKFVSKTASIDQLGKILGLWKDKDKDGNATLTADEFARALGEGIERARNRPQ